MRRLLAEYTEAEDLINVGAYAAGSNPVIDEAIGKMGAINGFLRQDIEDQAPLSKTLGAASGIVEMPIEAVAEAAEAESGMEADEKVQI
jgi:flagellum-specific ATP synthase